MSLEHLCAFGGKIGVKMVSKMTYRALKMIVKKGLKYRNFIIKWGLTGVIFLLKIINQVSFLYFTQILL